MPGTVPGIHILKDE